MIKILWYVKFHFFFCLDRCSYIVYYDPLIEFFSRDIIIQSVHWSPLYTNAPNAIGSIYFILTTVDEHSERYSVQQVPERCVLKIRAYLKSIIAKLSFISHLVSVLDEFSVLLLGTLLLRRWFGENYRSVSIFFRYCKMNTQRHLKISFRTFSTQH